MKALLITAVFLGLVGCQSAPPTAPSARSLQIPVSNHPGVRQLEEDSLQGVAPSSSRTFQDMVAPGATAPVAELDQRCRAGGAGALLPLLVLRRVSRPTYDALALKLKSSILASGLLYPPRVNAFGLPMQPFDEAAAAVVELGPKAVSPWVPLLALSRTAGLSGSRNATESRNSRLEACDYALALISAMVQVPFSYDPVVANRDQAIRALQAWLGANPTKWE